MKEWSGLARCGLRVSQSNPCNPGKPEDLRIPKVKKRVRYFFIEGRMIKWED